MCEAGEWQEALAPLIQRFQVAALFNADIVCDAQTSAAIAETMSEMAKNLDAVNASRSMDELAEAMGK